MRRGKNTGTVGYHYDFFHLFMSISLLNFAASSLYTND